MFIFSYQLASIDKFYFAVKFISTPKKIYLLKIQISKKLEHIFIHIFEIFKLNKTI